MTIKQAKQLREGSAFWSPSKNGHDKSGYRLHVVVGCMDTGVVTFDEHGLRFFIRDGSRWNIGWEYFK